MIFTEFSQTCGSPVDGKYAVASSVPALIFCAGPSAIRRLVISVVIYTLNCNAIWPFSHVGKEVFKVSPSWTHFYSSSSVMLKTVIFGIRASVNHLGPRAVGFRVMSRTGVSMPDRTIEKQATARLRLSREQLPPNHFSFCSAIAAAKAQLFSRWIFVDDFKISKFSTKKTYSSGHGIGSFNVVLSGRLLATTSTCRDFTQFSEALN